MNKLLACSLQFTILLLLLFSLPATHFKLTIAYAHSSTQIIEMTKDGFIPSEVTIDLNQAVIFLNKDDQTRWPASNTHPTHDLYPQFDPRKAINPGESWAFKPEKVGEWKFHDHLNPHMRGVVKVTAEVSQQRSNTSSGKNHFIAWIQSLKTSIVGIFNNIKNSFGPKINLDPTTFAKASSKEQEEMLKTYTDQQGAEKAWEHIKETFKGQAGSSGNIHDLAHLSGGYLFEKKGFEGLAKCTADFAFGCYHGFLDKAFSKNLDHLIDAQDACLKLGPEGSGPVGSCIHGIGHGVASFHSTSDLKASLADCLKLTSGREFCFDGVFMEFVRSAPDTFYSKEKPLYPCDELETQFGPYYSQACGRNQPSLLMGRFKMGIEDVIKVCLDSDSNAFKTACFDSIGFSFASQGDVDQIIKGCQSIEEEQFISTCLKSAAGELIFQEVPNWNQNSKAICNASPQGSEKICFDYINRIISEYGRKVN